MLDIRRAILDKTSAQKRSLDAKDNPRRGIQRDQKKGGVIAEDHIKRSNMGGGSGVGEQN